MEVEFVLEKRLSREHKASWPPRKAHDSALPPKPCSLSSGFGRLSMPARSLSSLGVLVTSPKVHWRCPEGKKHLTPLCIPPKSPAQAGNVESSINSHPSIYPLTSIYPSICPSFYAFIHLSIHPSPRIYPFTIHLSICPAHVL